jgi:hypothetical protein
MSLLTRAYSAALFIYVESIPQIPERVESESGYGNDSDIESSSVSTVVLFVRGQSNYANKSEGDKVAMSSSATPKRSAARHEPPNFFGMCGSHQTLREIKIEKSKFSKIAKSKIAKSKNQKNLKLENLKIF